MLTVAMGARLQGFPSDWRFSGGKTAQWGQVGNAFPAPAARAFGLAIAAALGGPAQRPGPEKTGPAGRRRTTP